MAGAVTSKSFSGHWAHLNGPRTITATHADLVRSLLTVGYPSRRAAIRVVGPWRERMLVAMATGYLDSALNTTPYFRNLEQSEKVGVSFLLGEAFTHWFAQQHMQIQFLVHVAGLSSCNWVSPTNPLAPKSGALPPALQSRPDFIGIRPRQRHVFESKGRIRAPSAASIGKALGQVSTLHSINGRAPTTRCASFFMLKSSGTEGLVVDPPSAQDGLGVVFDDYEALARAYAFFLDRPIDGFSDDVTAGYVGREIEEGVFFGIDKEILSVVSDRPSEARLRRRRVTEILARLEERSEEFSGRRDTNVSPGTDGTILVDRRSPPVRPRRRK